jgi:hypothetical protein
MRGAQTGEKEVQMRYSLEQLGDLKGREVEEKQRM